MRALNDWMRRLDAAISKTPLGRSYEALPWDEGGVEREQELPWYVRQTYSASSRVVWISIALCFGGFVFRLKVAAALGAGLLAMVALAYRRLWQETGALQCDVLPKMQRAEERANVKFQVTLVNELRRPTGPLVIRLAFDGSVEAEQFHLVPPLRGKERRIVNGIFKADRGMGEFKLGRILVIFQDPLGIFRRCIGFEVEAAAEVLPEETPMEALVLHVAGQTMHSGTVETRMSGDSPTFLGLRPYRLGDNVRRIDWKQSQKYRELVVREFERLNATDATLLVDQRELARFEYEGLNSFELIRDTAIALARNLVGQQVRVQLVVPGLTTPPGKGLAHLEWITDVIKGLSPTHTREFGAYVREALPLVPPDSVFIPVFARAGVDFEDLLASLFALTERRVEIIPVMVDTNQFEHQIMREARLTQDQAKYIWLAKANLGANAAMDLLANRLAEAAVVIGPAETIGSVYSRETAWRPTFGNL